MRRFSHVEDWGFTPVAEDEAMFPRRWPVRLSLRGAGAFGWLGVERMDVVLGRDHLYCRHRMLWRIKRSQRLEIKDFIGVAVRIGSARPNDLSRLRQRMLKGLEAVAQRLALAERLPALLRPRREADDRRLELFLLNEDCRSDVLLYRARDDHEITALWRYWSKALRLPQLLVKAGGLIEEPFEMAGAVAFSRACKRRKSYGLIGRRPGFSRVRAVGAAGSGRHCAGREIVARR